jgi:tetratricopeptide (TPR) repeat protein
LNSRHRDPKTTGTKRQTGANVDFRRRSPLHSELSTGLSCSNKVLGIKERKSIYGDIKWWESKDPKVVAAFQTFESVMFVDPQLYCDGIRSLCKDFDSGLMKALDVSELSFAESLGKAVRSAIEQRASSPDKEISLKFRVVRSQLEYLHTSYLKPETQNESQIFGAQPLKNEIIREAKTLVRDGKREEALKLLDRFLTREKLYDADRELQEAAVLYHKCGDQAQAKEIARMFELKNNAGELVLAAEIYANIGEHEKAEQCAQMINMKSPVLAGPVFIMLGKEGFAIEIAEKELDTENIRGAVGIYLELFWKKRNIHQDMPN